MRLINCSENPLFIDDIDVVIPYNRDGREPFEIDDSLVAKSLTLAYCMAKMMVIDVDKEIDMGTFRKRQAVLSTADPLLKEDQVVKLEKKPTPFEYIPGTVYAAWEGPAKDYGGYANMNRKFMFGLTQMGDRIRYDLVDSINDADAEINAKLAKLMATRVPDWAPKVYGRTAPLIYDWARYKMLFTMMETRTLHPQYAEQCNCADEVIVPSKWCAEVFKESGVKKPIMVIQLGVDTKLYCPGAEPIGFSKNLKDFVFISVFGWSMRKGYDVMLKAYLQEFNSDDPVTFLMMSRYFGSTDESKKKHIRDEIARISGMVDNPKKPQVVLFGDTLSEQLMPSLYAAAHCYVLISRGEGFGLPYAEAAACGLPVIGSRYSGQTDFLDDSNSYLVDVDGFRKAGKELSWISRFYEDAEFPIFGDQAVQQTRAHMRRVYENYEEAQQKAVRLRERILKEYDWSCGIQKMHEKLKQVNAERNPR